jgi:hypothetical protein
MAMICYDLLLNRGQENLRLICPTALASKRPSAHLFTDTIHKAVSNVLLETLGYELPYYTGKDCSVVDVARREVVNQRPLLRWFKKLIKSAKPM